MRSEACPVRMKRKPISTRMPEVVIEYDRQGERVSKTFDNPYEARRFYESKEKAVKHPRVRSVGMKGLRAMLQIDDPMLGTPRTLSAR